MSDDNRQERLSPASSSGNVAPGEGGGEVSFAAEAARFQAELAEDSRSSVLSNLFEYIVRESQDGRAPKEIEIAMEVFGKSATFDTAKSSMVRSHMHRLTSD